MTAEVKEQIGEIRGVNVRWASVIVAGHTVEQVLFFDVAEAEAVHGRPFDDELDENIQMGMFAVDRIAAGGTMHKVASARSYVLDGKCIRTAKIEHCSEIAPMVAGWSCVPGTEPMSHSDLPLVVESQERAGNAPRQMGVQAGGNDPPRPIDMCYWVVPGKLLAGEYPRNLDEPSSIEKLARLTEAGVSAFIDLTEEGEPLKPYAYLLNGPSHERFGIKDQSVPVTDELTKQALDAIDRHLEAGETVYVHCWGGVGRTGTIIGCWLSRHHEPGQAALDKLKELWKKNPKRHRRPRSPENDLQDDYILTWGDKKKPIAARYEGCLVGLAVGDAVGTTLEFKTPGTFEPLDDMVGGGPYRLQPGQWTDDTSMALCLAESLVTCEGFNASHQMGLYVRWWREGYLSSTGCCFDIGNTVKDALKRYQQTEFAMMGSTDPMSAGNGSLMRLAPVAMFFATDPELAIRLCGESSRTTHGARTCIDACRYFGGLIVGALRGGDKGRTALGEVLSGRRFVGAGSAVRGDRRDSHRLFQKP